MRHIHLFCATMFGLMTVACGASEDKKTENVVSDSLYFTELEKRVFNDPSAEFDTLSYAMGMQYALSAQGLLMESDVDRDLLVEAFYETLDAESLDCDALYHTIVKVGEFNDFRYMPWMSQVRRNKTLLYVDPEAEVEEPVLFDDEFTREEMSAAIGRKMASELRFMQVSINRYWVEQAFNDASALGEYMIIDSIMRIPIMQLSSIVGAKEHKQNMLDYNVARTTAWLDNVAKQDGVVPFTKEGQETVYYRVDNEGNDRRPEAKTDSIYMEYELYSCYGLPIESTSTMLSTIERYAIRIAKDPAIDEPKRIKLNAELARQRDMTEAGGATLESLYFDVLGDCLKEIGEGGTITIWMPASHISNVALASKNLVYNGMGGVMTIHLKRVVHKAEQAAKPLSVHLHPIQNVK